MIPLIIINNLEIKQLENPIIERAREILFNPLDSYFKTEYAGKGKRKTKKYSLHSVSFPREPKDGKMTYTDTILEIQNDFEFLSAVLKDKSLPVAQDYVNSHFNKNKALTFWNNGIKLLDKFSTLEIDESLVSLNQSRYSFTHHYSEGERLEMLASFPFNFHALYQKKRLWENKISARTTFNLKFGRFEAQDTIYQRYKDDQGLDKYRLVFSFFPVERNRFISEYFLNQVKEFENGLLV